MTMTYSKFETMLRLMEEAKELGMEITGDPYDINRGRFAIVPLNETPDGEGLPVYSRDAVIYSGTADDIYSFIRGVEWARQYDEILKLSDNERRKRKEQDVRNSNLALKLSQKEKE